MSFLLLAAAGALLHAQAPQSRPPAAKPDALAPARPARINAAAQRNENVAVYQIDTNAIKESNIRLGNTVTLISEPAIDRSYFGAEHGAGASEVIAPVAAGLAGWHAELFANHQNGVLNARTFFQVGDVLPSRRNHYGFRATASTGPLGSLTASGAQRKVRGVVNGNVLVPLESERTPLATDPRVRAAVSRFLAAYPAVLPNRLDFDPRALNTNSPHRGDDIDGSIRLDRELRPGKLSASHAMIRQRLDAFQLVAGQNPDTDIHTHRSRVGWRQAVSPVTELAVGFHFNRIRSSLLPEQNAIGPRVRVGFQIEELGPDSQFPISRAQNSFRGGAALTRQAAGGSHTMTLGGDLIRYQLNGIESNNQRGFFQFTNNFGRSAIENLRLGTPSTYEVTVGKLARGFRNWGADVFLADRWKLAPRVQLYYGLRYSMETAPYEVNGLTEIPYGCDCNNLSPRFAIAWQLSPAWMMRSSYTVSFGRVMPVTFQQARNNLPGVRYIQVANPDLLDPLGNIDLTDAHGRTSPTFLSADLVSPYAHQYNFALERRIASLWLVRLAYVGSRSYKLLNSFIMNRAEPVSGIPLTTATVDERRPDPRYYETKHIVNAGIAYLDAAQAAVELPLSRGLLLSAAYTFGKALDEGPDYAFTAANRDLTTGRSQWQYDSLRDKKGLSTFDSTHSLSVFYSYDLPRRAGHGTLDWIANGWQLSGATLLKSGTPLTLYIGSDTPGFGNVDGGPSDRPNIVDPSILGRTISHPDIAALILRRDRFAYIAPGEHRGSLARNSFRKAGIANFNAALARQWRISAHREWLAQLRLEAYNLTNHAQFDEPQRNLSAPAFGKITNSLNDGRVFQLGLRVVL
jgi:hypothetical protein